MERKTKIMAEDGRRDLTITREFDLPLELLFKAYAEPEIVEQWMGTKVLEMNNNIHGGFRFETNDGKGNVVFQAHGAIHEFVPEQKITRTFEMMNASFGVQLEFLEFTSLSDDRSKLTMQVIYRSGDLRDQNLKLPFSYGVNMAHDRLEEVLKSKLQSH